MTTKKLILGLLLTLVSYTAQSQETTVNFAKFKITTTASTESIKQLDQFIRSQNGVFISRIDPVGKTYFAKYDPSVINSPEIFKQWLETISVDVTCEVSGVYNGTVPEFPKDCFNNGDSDIHQLNTK